MFWRSKTTFVVDEQLHDLVTSLVRDAEETLDLASPWIGDLGHLMDGIRDSIALGVEVRVFTRRPTGSDAPHERAVRELQSNRVRLIFDDRLHAKMVICDRRVLLTMSANLTRSSLTDSHETGLLTEEKEAVRDAAAYLDELEDRTKGKQISDLASEISSLFRGQQSILRNIAARVGQPKDAVLRALQSLEEEGHLKVEERKAKAGHTYRLYVFEA